MSVSISDAYHKNVVCWTWPKRVNHRIFLILELNRRFLESLVKLKYRAYDIELVRNCQCV